MSAGARDGAAFMLEACLSTRSVVAKDLPQELRHLLCAANSWLQRSIAEGLRNKCTIGSRGPQP
jgi:hypothetical protein